MGSAPSSFILLAVQREVNRVFYILLFCRRRRRVDVSSTWFTCGKPKHSRSDLQSWPQPECGAFLWDTGSTLFCLCRIYLMMESFYILVDFRRLHWRWKEQYFAMERKRFVSREKIFFVRFSDHLWSLNDGGGGLSVRPAWSKRLWQNHLALMRAWQVSFMVEFCVSFSGKRGKRIMNR